MARRSHRAEISVNHRARTAGTPPVRGSRESPNEKGQQQCHQPLVGLILSSKSPISVRSIGRPPSYDKRLNQIFRWVVRSGGRGLVAAFGQALKDQRALSTKSMRDFGMARDEGSGCEQTAETYQFLRDYLDRRGREPPRCQGRSLGGGRIWNSAFDPELALQEQHRCTMIPGWRGICRRD